MPDCAAIRIEAFVDEDVDGYTRQAIARRLAEQLGWWEPDGSGTEIEWHPEDEVVAIRDYEFPWGLGSEATDALEFLQALQLPYRATDYGHYTWDGYTIVWAPGMPNDDDGGYDGIYVTTGVDGAPARFTIEQIEQHDIDELRAMANQNPIPMVDWERAVERRCTNALSAKVEDGDTTHWVYAECTQRRGHPHPLHDDGLTIDERVEQRLARITHDGRDKT